MGKNNTIWIILASALIFVGAIYLILYFGGALALVPEDAGVCLPNVVTLSCSQTRIAMYPTDNPNDYAEFSKGQSFYCSGVNYQQINAPERCHLSLAMSGFSGTLVKKCKADGSECSSNFESVQTQKAFLGERIYDITFNDDEKIYVTPIIWTKYFARTYAPVYGIKIEGSNTALYADRCNIAQLLTSHQITMLKDDPNYAEYVTMGEVSPSVLPAVFYDGCSIVYDGTNLVTISGESWFVRKVGERCRIKQDTAGKYIVSNECVADNNIQCIPNIGNCDANGKLTTDNSGKSCEVGTLIGLSQSGIVYLNTGQICEDYCDSGIVKYKNCRSVPVCQNGQVMSQDYECVDPIILTDKIKCEALGGVYTKTVNKDGSITTSCDTRGVDLTTIYIILALFAIAMVVLFVMAKNKRK